MCIILCHHSGLMLMTVQSTSYVITFTILRYNTTVAHPGNDGLVIKRNILIRPVLVMICSKSVSICNHSRARLVDSSRNHTFSRRYPNLMRSYSGLLEPRGSNVTPLKSTINAEHFICRLSWSILNGFCVYLQLFSC